MKSTVLATGRLKVDFLSGIRRVLGRMGFLWVVLLASLLLSGCVQYDVGVNFDSPNRGEIVQSIALEERLTAFSNATVKEWLDSIEQRAKQLQGRVKRVSDKELLVTIPFNNGAELEQKFNEFFNPTVKNEQKSVSVVSSAADLPQIQSHISLHQSNFLLWLRNWLSYDLDLRSLSLLSSDGNVLVSLGSAIDLEFRLNTPWGARSVAKAENAITSESRVEGHQLVWQLQPGEVNHLEAVFWMPSPLGIGAVMIALFVAGGIYLKYQLLPSRVPTPTRLAQ